jgi:hypothetical protein
MIDLGERAASSKKHFMPYRNDVMFSAEVARTMSPSVRSTSDDGRYSLIATGTPVSSKRGRRSKTASADLPIDPVIQELIPAGEGLIGDGHVRDGGGYPRNSRAIRMPSGQSRACACSR